MLCLLGTFDLILVYFPLLTMNAVGPWELEAAAWAAASVLDRRPSSCLCWQPWASSSWWAR